MAEQLDIFGGTTHVGEHTAEARKILATYPHYAEDPGAFLFACLTDRYKWPKYLPEQQQRQFREFLKDVQSLDRRRQEYKAKNPMPKPCKVETIEF